jgi:hypothetical protein
MPLLVDPSRFAANGCIHFALDASYQGRSKADICVSKLPQQGNLRVARPMLPDLDFGVFCFPQRSFQTGLKFLDRSLGHDFLP